MLRENAVIRTQRQTGKTEPCYRPEKERVSLYETRQTFRTVINRQNVQTTSYALKIAAKTNIEYMVPVVK